MFKLLAALVLVACSTLACAGGPAPTGELAGTTIDVVAVWADEERAAFERVLAVFERRTGADVVLTSAGDELPTVLQTSIAGGSPPDVAVLPQPGLITALARAGALAPLDAATERTVDEQYSAVWKDFGTVDGEFYGVVFKAANKSMVWYDAGAMGPGFVPPADWDGFVELLRRSADTGSTPLSVGGADGWTLTDWFENVYLQTAGADDYDRLARHEIPWTDPTVRVAFARLAEVFRPQYLPGGPDRALQTEFADSVVDVFSDDPSAVIVYEGDFVANVIRDSTPSVVGQDAMFFPFPGVDGAGAVGSRSVIGGGDLVVTLRDTRGAARLVEFLAGAEAAGIWAATGGFISPNREVPLATYPDELTRAAVRGLLDAGDDVRFDMSDLAPASFGGTKGDGLWKAMQHFLADPSRVQEILTELEAAAAVAYGGAP